MAESTHDRMQRTIRSEVAALAYAERRLARLPVQRDTADRTKYEEAGGHAADASQGSGPDVSVVGRAGAPRGGDPADGCGDPADGCDPAEDCGDRADGCGHPPEGCGNGAPTSPHGGR